MMGATAVHTLSTESVPIVCLCNRLACYPNCLEQLHVQGTKLVSSTSFQNGVKRKLLERDLCY